MRVTALLLAAVAWAIAVSGQNTSAWKEYAYPNDEFAMTLPYDPSPHQDARFPGTTTYSVHVGNGALTLRAINQEAGCASRLRELKEAEASATTLVAPVKDVSLNGHQGVEASFRTPQNEMMERGYCGGRKLFVFSVLWPRGQAMPPAIGRMLGSFRILESASRK